LVEILNSVAPFPEPNAPEVSVIQGTPLLALQTQDAEVVTLMVTLMASERVLTLVGLTLNEQATWLIVVVADPTLIVPLRAAPVLAATLYPMVPLPEPVAPEVIVIHDAPLMAVQSQDAAVDTLTAPVLAETGAPIVFGFRLIEQPVAWLIVVVAEPALIVPLRAGPLLGATVKPMLALPEPFGDVMVIHGTFVVADHAHVVVSDSGGPPPPTAGTASVVGLRR
jgi:hypothetical protein